MILLNLETACKNRHGKRKYSKSVDTYNTSKMERIFKNWMDQKDRKVLDVLIPVNGT